jgi:hypothetical protein
MATHPAAIESIAASSRPPQLRYRSQASSMVWITVAADGEFCWRDGSLVPTDGMRTDDPFCPVYGMAFGDAEPPSWVREGLVALDRELPPIHLAEAALTTRDLVAPLNPPVGRIPEANDEYAAALCIFASRLLLSCQHRLIPPAFVPVATSISNLQDASFLAASVGGQGAIMEAIRIASRRRTYEVTPETDDIVEFGEDDQ